MMDWFVAFFKNYYDIFALVMYGLGFGILLLNKNMLKKLVGFDLMDAASFIFLTSKGFVGGGRVAPILDPGSGITSYSYFTNPIPTGLVLTGIVVGVSVTAFCLALIYRLYRIYHSLDLDEIMRLRRLEERRSA